MSKVEVLNEEINLDKDQTHFTFGDPIPIPKANMLDYLGVFEDMNMDYYIPPIDMNGLSMMRRASGHHGSCVAFRQKTTANAYVSGPMSVQEFSSSVTDVLTFGNCYYQILENLFGTPTGLAHVPALNMRKRTNNKGYRLVKPGGKYIDFPPEKIIHIKEYDTQQQIYGIPDWIGGLQSALLNEDATLFRRKYFVNGAHLGYILYTNERKLDPKLVKELKQKVKEGKGVGNFRSLHVHVPGGNEEAIKVIPIGDISQKDEFSKIKSISAADIREAHRVPPILMGVVPEKGGSLGDATKVKTVYDEIETQSMARTFLKINESLPKHLHLKFKDFSKKQED